MRLHPSLLILGYSEATEFLRDSARANLEAIIAIHSQHDHALATDSVPYQLVLEFDDCEVQSRSDILNAARTRLRQRHAEQFSLQLVLPTIEHAKAIINFAQSIREIEGTLLCQCQGGISRSPAAALLCLAAWTDPGWEDYCVRQVLAVRPCAVPHPDIVAFGDEILQRKGKLVEALERAETSPTG